MNVEHQHAAPARTEHPRAPAPESVNHSLPWREIVSLRTLNPKCDLTKAAVTLAAEHPESVFGAEIETFIGKTVIGTPALNLQQAMALRRLAVLEDHEVTLDALRDTGLPLDLAIDLAQRLNARPAGWTIFERITHTPTLEEWSRSVLLREPGVQVADDVLTLRILQTFGHDVSVPWSFDATNKRVSFYSSNHAGSTSCLAHLLDFATLDHPSGCTVRDVCRKGYQALAHAHSGAGDQVWPHWKARGDGWEIYPDPRNESAIDEVVFASSVTCDTERWLRNVTRAGCLDVEDSSAHTAVNFEIDLSDADIVMRDLRRAARHALLPATPRHTDGSEAPRD